uniref:Uncharacterized protein n=1 Tax=viral metagenome TaxID=1070528 RepID=A0A6C0DQ82_9ZZZZ
MNQYIFNNINGELVGGVSIKNQIKSDKNNFMGGGSDEETGINVGEARFNNLVVPAGLYTSSQMGGKSNKKEVESECISDGLYEKLFGMVRYDIPTKNRKTKKNYVVKNKSKKTM